MRLYDLLGPAMERISLQMESGQGIVGIPTGFHDLDRMTGGFKDSDLIIVAGRPAMGKCIKYDSLIVNFATGQRLTIEEAVQGNLPEVFGFGADGAIRPNKVGEWVDSGVTPCFKVTPPSGTPAEPPLHHPFLPEPDYHPPHTAP